MTNIKCNYYHGQKLIIATHRRIQALEKGGDQKKKGGGGTDIVIHTILGEERGETTGKRGTVALSPPPGSAYATEHIA